VHIFQVHNVYISGLQVPVLCITW